jgi:signal transduction histidine kinase
MSAITPPDDAAPARPVTSHDVGTSGPAAAPASAPPLPVLTRLFGPVVDPRTWKRTAHLLADLPLGIAWFTVVVTGLSVGFGSIVTLIGIPVLLALLLFSRVISAVERARAGVLLDTRIPSPFGHGLSGGTIWQKVKGLVTDAAAWKALVYGVVMLPLGIFNFTIAVTLWAVALGGLTYVLWGWSLPQGEDDWTLWYRGDLDGGEFAVVVLVYFMAGLVVLLATPHVMRGLAALDRGLIRGLLGVGETAALQRRVDQLAESRDASVDAAETERRRIERDLHDGAQQRLVALAMDLGLARERLATSSDARTAELVGQAHDEAKQAITELRELVRGIHPAVLTDRGLDAALSAVAARCPVPVDLQVDLPAERPPAPVETTAYFVVTEALTNAAKHSHAHQVRVRVVRRDEWLVVDVADDGVGGATVERAGGLAGLSDRVRAVEGVMRLASPPGGPTNLLVELPWPA